jgi:hypothetical protein
MAMIFGLEKVTFLLGETRMKSDHYIEILRTLNAYVF